jgi:hypothetical protein
VLDVAGATPALAEPSQPLTTLQATGPSRFTLRLTVTDDLGAQDATDVAVATSEPLPPPEPPPSAPPAPRSGGGGGGGAPSLLLLALLFGAARTGGYWGGNSFCARSRR